MAFGWKNPLPFKLGGGPTTVELTYEELRKALGRGPNNTLAIGPIDGLRDLWTKCEALAVACAMAHWEHAIWQAFPHTSTSFLTIWENLLLIPEADDIVARQRLVASAYTREIDATIPGLREQLQELDPRWDVDSVPEQFTITTMAGREFGPHDGVAGAPYGSGVAAGRRSTAWPNFSDYFICRVRYEGIPSDEAIALAMDLLNDVLPTWVEFEIFNMSDGDEGEGFYADGGPDSDSFTDLTGITP